MDAAIELTLPSYTHCFCCGQGNDCGLRLVFREVAGEARTEWCPAARHGGYRGIVHGGVAAAVLDETLGWGAYLGSKLMVVTADLSVRYSRSLEIGRPVTVRARMVENQRDRIVHATGEIVDGDGRVAMKAKGRFIPVPRATVDEVQRYLTQPEGTPALEYRNRP